MTLRSRVVISVLNWNGADRTLACLAALRQLTYPDVHIIVVDNASTDDSAQRITAAYPDVELIRAASNEGYAAGNALALRRALDENADLFWIVNNDTLPEQDALTALVEAYRRRGAALYGSVTLDEDNDTILTTAWALDGQGKPDYQNLLLGKSFAASFPDGQDRDFANLMGNSLLVPLDVVRRHGFMDTSFFLYWEETDYCYRLRREGVKSMLVAASRVRHPRGQAHKHASPLKPVTTYYNVRNRLLWARRYFSAAAYARLVLQNVGFTLLRYLSPLRRGRAALPVALYATRGVWDGLRGRAGKTYAPEEYI